MINMKENYLKEGSRYHGITGSGDREINGSLPVTVHPPTACRCSFIGGTNAVKLDVTRHPSLVTLNPQSKTYRAKVKGHCPNT